MRKDDGAGGSSRVKQRQGGQTARAGRRLGLTGSGGAGVAGIAASQTGRRRRLADTAAAQSGRERAGQGAMEEGGAASISPAVSEH